MGVDDELGARDVVLVLDEGIGVLVVGACVVVGSCVVLEVETGAVEVGPGVQSFTNGAVVHAHAGHVSQTHGAGVDELVVTGAVLLVVGAGVVGVGEVTGAMLGAVADIGLVRTTTGVARYIVDKSCRGLYSLHFGFLEVGHY